ncbi:hypothetical protein ABGB14_12910 [Nonomuraea sp. B10E15]|uniref:hypothetical protein n=1 Tax=Nonomuraea sp. B10E15 TaxID=3153560 RepID=UPI00325DC742
MAAPDGVMSVRNGTSGKRTSVTAWLPLAASASRMRNVRAFKGHRLLERGGTGDWPAQRERSADRPPT